MYFVVEPTDALPPAPRYAVVNDAAIRVALCDYRQWADHIAALLTADGRDMHPTPAEQVAQEDADQAERMRREAEL